MADPYAVFARIYDRAMDHVDYEEWADYIILLFRKFSNHVHDVLDGGCGTGSLLKVLGNRGYKTAGFDRSLSMVRVASHKIHCPLWLADLRNVQCRRQWDAVISLYDTIQYFTIDELEGLFFHVRSLLNPLGLFIFDVITQKHARADWGNYTEQDEWDGIEYIRHTRYDKRQRLLRTEFFFYHLNNKNRTMEKHRQYIFPLNEIHSRAEAAGFTVLGVFDEFTMDRGTEDSDRVHFVLCKEAS